MADGTLELLATFIAAHALPLLCGVSIALLAAAWLLWRAIERWAPGLVALARPAWHSLDRRRFAARFLGWHGSVAFIVAALGLAAFFELAENIGADEELAAFDDALAAALAHELGPATLAFFGKLTWLGDPRVLVPLAMLVTVALWRRATLLAWSWVAATAGGALLNQLLKILFARSRPLHAHAFADANGYSFPSGHASASMLVYGLGAYLIVRHVPRPWHVPVAGAALLLIVFVGASRVLLQVHFASDVLAGWAVAATWTALCVAALEAVRLAPRKS
jgi:undecaprenyl-diphosphatase